MNSLFGYSLYFLEPPKINLNLERCKLLGRGLDELKTVRLIFLLHQL